MSAPCSRTAALEVALVLRVDRVGRVVRERAVELGEQVVQRRPGRRARTAGDHEPAHAVRRVGHDA